MFSRRMTTEAVEAAVKAALHPTDKTPVPKRVAELATAITRAAEPPFDRHGRIVLDPLPSREIAVKAANLAPTGGVTPDAIELAMHRQGVDFAEPFAPGKPLVPYYGYNRQPRRYNYLVGRNINTSVRDGRIAFDTLKTIIDGYDIAETCFAPGTGIVTKRGVVPIEDVHVGDEVITHMGRWRPVTETMIHQDHRPTMRLRSRGLDAVTCTSDHLMRTVRYTHTQQRRRVPASVDWVAAGDLNVQQSGSQWHYDALTLPVLAVEDRVPTLDVASHTNGFYAVDGMLTRKFGAGRLVRVPARVPMGAELGRIVGWYVAEGSQSHGRSVSFALSENERHIAKQILADIFDVFGVEGHVEHRPESHSLVVRVSSSPLAQLLSCGTARTKTIPAWAWDGGRAFLDAMLDSWAEGDGCRGMRAGWSPRRTVVTASRSLAWQMRLVAISLGYKASIVRNRYNENRPGVIRGSSFTTGPACYHVQWTEGPKRTGQFSYEDDPEGARVLAAAVTSVEDDPYVGPVYNLEVADDHSYTTVGGVAHNCVRHTINDLRSMPLEFRPLDGHMKDAEKEIAEAKRFLRRPDGYQPFVTWFAQWANDVFRYDAGCLWRQRSASGRVSALKVVDGKTIMPVIDYYGDVPDGAAPAFQQVIEGLPWIDFVRDDLIYLPQWPQSDSVYGKPAIETVLINANTDVRLQMFFLGFFSEGTVPEMMLEAPADMSSPEDLAELQETWDDWYLNNQAGRHGARWIPAGSKPFPYKQIHQMDPRIAEYVMRRTCAAFGRTPQDLGITDNVNRATSDTQVDVEFRISTVPNTEYFEAILNGVLQDDLSLPVAVKFDDGREKEDRLVEAQAHQIYVSIGAESPDEVRGNILGLPVDNGNRVPRMFDSARLGPVPLAYLFGASGEIDPKTLSPVPGSHGNFIPVENLQEQIPGVDQDHAATPTLVGPQSGPGGTPNTPRTPKPAAKADTQAFTRALLDAGLAVADGRASEMRAFKRFIQGHAKDGKWRNFHFETVDGRVARELNRRGAAEVARTKGNIICGGLAVVARDTGRAVLLRRADGPDDPAGGMWEFPGGHMEGDETPKQAAYREWQEETGILLPYVPWEPDTSWVASNGIYQGFVWLIDSEADIDLHARDVINPDDPDGDATEALKWASRADMLAEPDLRTEMKTDLPLALAAIDAALVEPAGKAANPKGQNRRTRPGSRYEQALVAYWTTALTTTIRLTESAAALAAKLFAIFAVAGAFASRRAIAAHVETDTDVLTKRLHNLYADAYTAGAKDTVDDLGGRLTPDAPIRGVVGQVDWESWKPGSNVRAPLGSAGFTDLLARDGVTIRGIDDVTRDRIGEAVANAIRDGQSADQAAAAIDRILSDPQRAHLIAVTEINRAMSAATIETYRQNGAEMWDLITASDPCPICADIAAANPHPITDTETPPEHPNCRCSLAQHIEE